MRRAGFGSKLAVLVAALGVPVAAVGWLYLETLDAQRLAAAERLDGVQAVRVVRGVLESALESQDAHGAISLDAVASVEQRSSLAPENAARIEDSLNSLASDPAERVEAMVYLIANLGDETGLTVDPDTSTRTISRVVSQSIPSTAGLLRAPEKVETVSPIDATVTRNTDSENTDVVQEAPQQQTALDATLEESAPVTLVATSPRVNVHAAAAQRRFQRVLADLAAADPGLAGQLESVSTQAQKSMAAWAAEQESSWTSPPDDSYRRQASAALFALEDALLNELDQRLAQALATHQQERYAQLGAAGFVLALALVLALLFYRSSIGQLTGIKSALERLSKGDFNARAEVRGSNEVRQVAGALNEVIEDLALRMKSVEEREHIEESIEHLLEDLAGVAEGDAARDSQSASGLTSSIAQSFDSMVGELRNAISQVQSTATQVSGAANKLQDATDQLAEGSIQQSARIADATSAVDEITESINQVSTNAAEAAEVAQDALANARRGVDAVAKTIAGMGSIRERVQGTAKRIKRLGESSQEIGEIVQLIGDVADRTSILALNAAIKAANAGEAGHGFALVAEQMEQLAERASEAAQRISSVIQSIQGEAQAAVTAMEDATSEVVGGSSLANEAGETLEQVESVSQQLAELIDSISAASRRQERGSASVARSMNDISGVTQQTASGASETAASIRNLAKLADDLRESVKPFRLPADVG